MVTFRSSSFQSSLPKQWATEGFSVAEPPIIGWDTNYFTEMCSGSSTLGLRVIKKQRRVGISAGKKHMSLRMAYRRVMGFIRCWDMLETPL